MPRRSSPDPRLESDRLLQRDARGRRLPELPVERSHAPGFATIGRPPPRDGLWSKPLMFIAAMAIFASFVALMADLQTNRPVRTVEVTFMEEEAAAAAAGLDAAPAEAAAAETPAAEPPAAEPPAAEPPAAEAASEAPAEGSAVDR